MLQLAVRLELLQLALPAGGAGPLGVGRCHRRDAGSAARIVDLPGSLAKLPGRAGADRALSTVPPAALMISVFFRALPL